MEQTKELGTMPIPKLIARFSIPAVIAMLVNAIYNVVDRIFIGKIVGEDALAGLTIDFPIMMLTFAIASLIGAGGAALLAIRLGEQDYKGASHVFGNTVTFGIIFNAVVALALLFNLNDILIWLKAEGNILVQASSYMKIILAGNIFMMFGFIFSNFVRTEGKPFLSMIAMIISAVTNIILDYVFIGLMGLGVAGAAYGTIIGQFVGVVIYLSYYFRGKSNIHLIARDFVPDFKVLVSIMSVGVSTFIATIGTSCAMMFINQSLQTYGGNEAITSMGAINSLYTFFIMPIMGVTTGIQPIIGYNYGANQLERSYKTLKIGVIIGTVFSTVVFLLMETMAPTFVLLFLNAGSATIDIASTGLRIFVIMLPLLSISLMGTAFFQSVAMGRVAMVLGMLRQFIFLLPLLFILPRFWGINGVWFATPIADGLSVAAALTALMIKRRSDKNEQKPAVSLV